MGSKKIICRVPPRAPGKEAFAGCQVKGHPAKKFKKNKKIPCRVPNGVAPGKGWRQLSTVKPATFAGGHILPSGRHPTKTIFADGWNLPSARHPAKAALPEAFLCRVSPGLAPGKEFLCQVPDKKHPANFFAPGKSAVSCCESLQTYVALCLSRISKLGIVVVMYLKPSCL